MACAGPSRVVRQAGSPTAASAVAAGAEPCIPEEESGEAEDPCGEEADLGACEQAETHSIVQQTTMTARSTPWSVTLLVSPGPRHHRGDPMRISSTPARFRSSDRRVNVKQRVVALSSEEVRSIDPTSTAVRLLSPGTGELIWDGKVLGREGNCIGHRSDIWLRSASHEL